MQSYTDAAQSDKGSATTAPIPQPTAGALAAALAQATGLRPPRPLSIEKRQAVMQLAIDYLATLDDSEMFKFVITEIADYWFGQAEWIKPGTPPTIQNSPRLAGFAAEVARCAGLNPPRVFGDDEQKAALQFLLNCQATAEQNPSFDVAYGLLAARLARG